MAKLTAQERAALKPSQFGLPDQARTTKAHKQSGNYPIPDRGRAISAWPPKRRPAARRRRTVAARMPEVGTRPGGFTLAETRLVGAPHTWAPRRCLVHSSAGRAPPWTGFGPSR